MILSSINSPLYSPTEISLYVLRQVFDGPWNISQKVVIIAFVKSSQENRAPEAGGPQSQRRSPNMKAV
jgi:hypothetical protein